MLLFTMVFLGWRKKSVEMGPYGANELTRNTNLQKKAVNYGLNKLTPLIRDSVGTAMDKL